MLTSQVLIVLYMMIPSKANDDSVSCRPAASVRPCFGPPSARISGTGTGTAIQRE